MADGGQPSYTRVPEPSFEGRNLCADIFFEAGMYGLYAVHETGIQLESYRSMQIVSMEPSSMQSNTLSPEELVEFARLLYGDQWREELSKHLNISRKKLVLTLASGEPVPEDMVSPFLKLMEEHLRKQEELSTKMQRRVSEIRSGSEGVKQPRVARRTAS